jgi:predicted nucleic acid-binding protein
MSTPVVFDVNILVAAVHGGDQEFCSWPSPPPVSENAAADCLGIANDAREFALWLSPHILRNTARALTEGLGWANDRVTEYVSILVEIAQVSGGGVLEPDCVVGDCPDYEDNRILELAYASGAILIVSEDKDLTSMSPWRGIPVVRPREFASRVDVMRRQRRRMSP